MKVCWWKDRFLENGTLFQNHSKKSHFFKSKASDQYNWINDARFDCFAQTYLVFLDVLPLNCHFWLILGSSLRLLLFLTLQSLERSATCVVMQLLRIACVVEFYSQTCFSLVWRICVRLEKSATDVLWRCFIVSLSGISEILDTVYHTVNAAQLRILESWNLKSDESDC